jgi:hypothetical protein
MSNATLRFHQPGIGDHHLVGGLQQARGRSSRPGAAVRERGEGLSSMSRGHTSAEERWQELLVFVAGKRIVGIAPSDDYRLSAEQG